MRLDDPRPDSARVADKALMDAAKLTSTAPASEDFDMSKLNSLGIKWGEDVLEVRLLHLSIHLLSSLAHAFSFSFLRSPSGRTTLY